MKENYRKWNYAVVGVVFGVIYGIVFLNFSIDPLQFYRKAFYSPVFSTNERLQNPGIAKNYEYDTVIIGTSVAQNFVPSQVDQQWQCSTVKLTMAGATLKEEFLVAKLALKTGKVKRVLWGVDIFSPRGNKNRVRDDNGEFPYYFYDNNPVNDMKYLLNESTTEDSMKIIKGIIQGKKTDEMSLDTLNNWNSKFIYSKENTLKKFKNDLPVLEKEINIEEYTFSHFKESIDYNLVALMEQYPDVEFIVFFPPYSMLAYQFYDSQNSQIIDTWLQSKQYIVQKTKKMPNVKAFDFQLAYHISENLDNYRDPWHYSQKINEFIIDQISNNKYRIYSEEEYAKDLLDFRARVRKTSFVSI